MNLAKRPDDDIHVVRKRIMPVNHALLAEYREHWIASRLVFREEGSYHVRTVIDVDSTLCDLVDTLHLRVMGSSILVAHVMGAVCQWEEWTGSQWVSIGDTSIFLGCSVARHW